MSQTGNAHAASPNSGTQQTRGGAIVEEWRGAEMGGREAESGTHITLVPPSPLPSLCRALPAPALSGPGRLCPQVEGDDDDDNESLATLDPNNLDADAPEEADETYVCSPPPTAPLSPTPLALTALLLALSTAWAFLYPTRMLQGEGRGRVWSVRSRACAGYSRRGGDGIAGEHGQNQARKIRIFPR